MLAVEDGAEQCAGDVSLDMIRAVHVGTVLEANRVARAQDAATGLAGSDALLTDLVGAALAVVVVGVLADAGGLADVPAVEEAGGVVSARQGKVTLPLVECFSYTYNVSINTLKPSNYVFNTASDYAQHRLKRRDLENSHGRKSLSG